MSKKGVEQRHSKTAILAALRRALANKEYKNERFGPDDLAEYFLPSHMKFFIKFKNIRIKVKNKMNKFLPGMHEYLIGRTAYFDSVFIDALKENIPQIVLLGAGYDTRAYRFAKLNNATKIFELDVATTQNRKKKCLKKARLNIPSHALFVPINFDKESLKTVLETAGYENDKKTLFLWEGVCYYLEPKSVDATLEFVSHSSHSESVIAFDYAISISEENINNYYGAKELAQTMRKYHSDERFKFVVNEGKMESFLEKRGLKVVNHLDNKEIEEKYLLDENGLLIGRITGSFRFVSASPNSKTP
ncbi:MAG: SAM-dependent methyltransferase [Proteobacteria bacterium]|nr:SAM-dependent methyltransferase [Pseudomonadota bacterium]MBU1740215.1 SAM-dependent methyltransferase [Pseudomonadota bacterium]